MSSFSRVYLSGSKADPDKIYYNATIASNTLPSANNVAQNPSLLTFGESRQTTLVVDASRYEVQVESVTLSGPTKTLPLFIPTIASPSTDVQSTIYTVYVNVYSSSTYIQGSAPVIWSPEDPYASVPSLGTTQSDSDYYYCYTYDHWVKLVNAALYTAWLSAGGGVAFGTKAPFIEYDQTTGLFDVNADAYTSIVPVGVPLPSPYNVSNVPTTAPDVSYSAVSVVSDVATFTIAEASAPYTNGQIVQIPGLTLTGPYVVISSTTTDVVVNIAGSTGSPDPTGTILATNYTSGEYSFIGMNKQLYQLLSNFNTVAYKDNTVWGGGLYYPEVVLDYGMPVLSTNIVNASPNGTGLKTYPSVSVYPLTNPFTAAALLPYARLVQNFTGTDNWSPVASIVVGTTKIPVRNEENSATFSYGTSNIGIENNSSSNFFKTLIEFPVPMNVANLTRQYISYQPQTPTFSSMDDSHVDIHDVDFQFYWRSNRTGQLNPIKIDTGSFATIRLVFEKKK